jgi:hypothetical protein
MGDRFSGKFVDLSETCQNAVQETVLDWVSGGGLSNQ